VSNLLIYKRTKKYIRLKYTIAWYVGILFFFILYFSGIVPVYIFFRKKYLKQYLTFVLMYHRIDNVKTDRDITVSIKNFENQMKYLRQNYDVISLDTLLSRHKQNHIKQIDEIAVTFDDGFKDNFTNAFPILRKYDIPASIFVATNFIDKNEGLSREDIFLMKKRNIAFGSHTRTHNVLSETDKNSALEEIRGSKKILEEILQDDVRYFAYPYGKRELDFNDDSMRIVKEAGYSAAFSTNNGCITNNSDIFALERLGVRDFPMFVFKVRISGIFENKWIHILWKYLGV